MSNRFNVIEQAKAGAELLRRRLTQPYTLRYDRSQPTPTPTEAAAPQGFFERLFGTGTTQISGKGMGSPTVTPSAVPTAIPTNIPTQIPTQIPTNAPTQSLPFAQEEVQPSLDISRKLVKKGIKEEYVPLVTRFSQGTGLSPLISAGIALNENRGQNPNAVGPDGNDFGYWQIRGIPEFDPVKNTENAIRIFNNKKSHFQGFGITKPTLGMLIQAYNKGAAGVLTHADPNATYAKQAFKNVGLNPSTDPYLNNPKRYLSQFDTKL